MANPNLYYEILRKPLLTEKSTMLQEANNQYTFEVLPTASKNEIKKAIETLFEVEVLNVNVVSVPGKFRRMFGRPGKTKPWKKALVQLKEGQAIDAV